MNAMALYHTHRPQDFSAIIGQEHIVETLKNQIMNGKVAHAYLFTGPRGVGKTTTARVLAKAVNCPRKKDSPDPDNATECAIEINESRSIDVIEIDAASHTGVDNVRENIIENARFKPTKLPYKIFIIDEVHMLSTSAFNALLKTLEEPPAHVLFILATTELSKLPETIISRCQVFHFKKVGYEPLKKHIEEIAELEGISVEKDVLDRIIRKSDGCVRDAVGLLDQIMASGEKKITVETAMMTLPSSHTEESLAFVETFIKKDAKAGLNQIRAMDERGIRAEEYATDVIELLRIMMLMKAQGSVKGLGIDLSSAAEKEIAAFRALIEGHDLIRLIDLLLKRRQEIKTSPFPSLPLEMAVIEWSGDCMNDRKKESETQPVQEPSVSETDAVPMSPAVLSDASPLVKQKEKKTLKEKVKEMVRKEKPLEEEEVRQKWQQCIQKIEVESPSLVFILKMAELTRVYDNTVEISVGYRFHRDKLTHVPVKKKLDAILSDVIGANAHLSIILGERNMADASVSQAETKENEELRELASAFGGKIAG